MPPIALSHSLPLLRGWPRRVRSAVGPVNGAQLDPLDLETELGEKEAPW